MRTQAVHDYVRKKKLRAADGGEVPEIDADEVPEVDAGENKKKKTDDSNPFDRGDDSPFRFSQTASPPKLSVSPLYAADGGEVPEDDGYYDSEQKQWMPNQPSDAAQPDHGLMLADAAPAARTGNPVDDIENGAEEDDSEPDDPAGSPAPASAAAPDRDQVMRDYLAKQYGKAADDSGIKTAVEDARHQNFLANLGEGLHEMVTARGVANGAAPDSGRFFQGMRDQGQAGIAQASAARDQKVKGFLQTNQMNRQVAQDQMTKGTYENQQKAAKLTQDMNDPKSDYSASMRAPFVKLWGDKLEGADADKMSAAQMHTFAEQLEKKSAIDSRSADAQARADALVEAGKGRNQAHADAVSARNQAAKDAKDAKESGTDLKLATEDFKNLRTDLDSDNSSSRTQLGVAAGKVHGADRVMKFAETSIDDLAKAEKDPKAKAALIAKLDNLTPQQYGEVVSGLMSQIAPGSGSLGQLEHLRADTAEQTKANLITYFTSKTAGAGAGDLIYNNLKSLKNERDVSKGVLDSHKAIQKDAHPWAFSHAKTKDLAEKMFNKYAGVPEDDAEDPAAKPATPPQGGPGMAVGAPAGRTPVKKEVNAKLGKTRITYSDGTSEVVDGRQ